MKKYSIATFLLLAILVLSLPTGFAYADDDDRYEERYDDDDRYEERYDDDKAELVSLREENQRLRDEIKSLQEQLEDMQEVLMEQIKVIMETLATIKSQ